jgi:hypothetical protein
LSNRILSRSAVLGHPYPDRLLEYPGAGHGFAIPYSPILAFTGDGLGGTPAVQAAASLDQWRVTLRFLP